jgi:hypothetical protein
MADRKLVGQLVEHYWELNDTIETIEMLGNFDVEEITLLRDIQIDLDKILTNSSKRWAKGIKERVKTNTNNLETTDLPTPVALHRS